MYVGFGDRRYQRRHHVQFRLPAGQSVVLEGQAPTASTIHLIAASGGTRSASLGLRFRRLRHLTPVTSPFKEAPCLLSPRAPPTT